MSRIQLQILPVTLFLLLILVPVKVCAGETEEYPSENMSSAANIESDEDEVDQDMGILLTEQESYNEEIHFGWYKKDSGWYYYSPVSGRIQTGWQRIGNFWYYLDGDNTEYPGLMVSGERRWINNAWYCFETNGAMKTGWVKRDEGWYYTNPGGAVQTGWQRIGNFWYYLDGDNTEYPGLMVSGERKWINNAWYCFETNGAMKAGWVKRDEGWYYTNPGGAVQTGWQRVGSFWYYLDGGNAEYPGLMVSGERRWINNAWYCFETNGAMKTGWIKRDEAWYYANPGGAVQTGWQKIGGFWYYMDDSGKMLTGWQKLNERWYYLHSSGIMVSGRQIINGIVYYFDNNSGALAEISLDNLIRNAAQPLGKTLYVWGGGWNTADNAAGEAALCDGVWTEWEIYFQANKNGYSYRPGQTSWKNGNRQWRLKGLDCSGYLGWLLYNSVTGGRNMAGYVVSASGFASSLTNYGFGSVAACTRSSTFLPGDIVSLSSGHCYLVLGQCGDGSVLLLHSTPNGGVQVSGTVKNSGSSEASRLAQDFMRQNYPEWWSSFGSEGRQSVNADTYLNGIKFSWQMNGSVSDPSGIRSMTGEQILNCLR